MKIIKHIAVPDKKINNLIEYVEKNVPESMYLTSIWEGYYNIYVIKLKEKQKYLGFFSGPTIAEIESNRIKLYYPEYYSDFEKIGIEYEKNTGKEVTLIYWES
jgi:hypothetical protein